MSMVETKNKAVQRPREGVLSVFDEFERVGRGSTPSWVQALHKGGISHFAELGFPTIQQEEWRFTNVAPIARTAWQLPDSTCHVTQKELSSLLFPVSGRRIVFVDGTFSRDLSSKDPAPGAGVRVQNIHEAVRSTTPLVTQTLARYARYDESSFVALNTAFLHDG